MNVWNKKTLFFPIISLFLVSPSILNAGTVSIRILNEGRGDGYIRLGQKKITSNQMNYWADVLHPHETIKDFLFNKEVPTGKYELSIRLLGDLGSNNGTRYDEIIDIPAQGSISLNYIIKRQGNNKQIIKS